MHPDILNPAQHPELLLMPDALTTGNVRLLRQTTPTDLRNPVGQHIRRTIEATAWTKPRIVWERPPPDPMGVALLLALVMLPLWVVVVWFGYPGVRAGLGLIADYATVLWNVLRVVGL